jgi:pimeloyl-ACP methyl ester carboxylesterase
VFVHGAWADGCSWNDVIRRLQKAGYKVTAVQIPLTSLADDVARTRQVLVEQDGPTILVGHSYGGAVITQLGTDAPNVVALVYVAALGPDEGETLQGLLSQGSELPPGLLHPDQQDFIWFDRDGFVRGTWSPRTIKYFRQMPSTLWHSVWRQPSHRWHRATFPS